MKLRFAVPADSGALLAIYGQYISTPVTFEYDLPSGEEFARRVEDISRDYPYLVCEDGGKLVGYAYAHRQMERAAYQWNAELSVYLDREHTAQGLGKKLYGCLMELLRLQGVRTVYGVVTVPNEKSEGLHRAMGFHTMGVCRSTGYKSGAWHDVAWFEKAIAPYDRDPEPFRPIRELPAERLADILEQYQ